MGPPRRRSGSERRALTRVRPLVADRARSRVRREDVGDGSATEGRGADRLDGERRVEEPLARAQDDRMHDEPVLVDQAGLDQASTRLMRVLGGRVSTT